MFAIRRTVVEMLELSQHDLDTMFPDTEHTVEALTAEVRDLPFNDLIDLIEHMDRFADTVTYRWEVVQL